MYELQFFKYAYYADFKNKMLNYTSCFQSFLKLQELNVYIFR